MIVLFCGIPGCGKTTIAELLANRLRELGEVQVLSSDKLRQPVYRKILRALAPDQKRAPFLILDATFYKKKWRDEVAQLAQDEKLMTVYLDCPLQTALERNKNRQPNISARAVHIVYHQMEPPESPSIRIDTSIVSADDAAAKIFEYLKQQL